MGTKQSDTGKRSFRIMGIEFRKCVFLINCIELILFYFKYFVFMNNSILLFILILFSCNEMIF